MYSIKIRLSLLIMLFGLTACGGGGDGGGDTGGTNPPATTPDSFQFATVDPVLPGTQITSSKITVAGLSNDVAAKVTVANGEYAISGETFGTAEGSVRNGDTLRVRGVASATPGDTVSVRLDVGGVSDALEIVTASADTLADTHPADLRLEYGSDDVVMPGEEVTSAPVEVSGINTCVPISISGGEYRLDGGEWMSEPGTVCPGQELEVRGVAPAETNAVSLIGLNIAGITQAFAMVTPPAEGEADTVPEPVAVGAPADVDLGNVDPGQPVVFPAFEVTGFSGPTAINITDGEFSLDGGNTWNGTSATVNPGDSVTVRVSAPEQFGATHQTVLNIGDIPIFFTVRTEDATDGSDAEPDAFSFSSRNGMSPNIDVASDAVAITGIDTVATVSVDGPEGTVYRINGGMWRADQSAIVTGQTLQLRVHSASEAGGSVAATATVGGVESAFTVTTAVVENQAPAAHAAALSQSVTEGVQVTLDASASSDPEGNALNYQWEQTAGPGVVLTDATNVKPHFTAPQVSANTVLTFMVTVSDGELATSASVNINVADVAATNHAPEVDAGEPQSVVAGATVSLDGRGSSDANGDSLTFAWTQVGADDIAIANSAGVTATFTAPSVSESTVFTFQLIVSDGELESSATVDVTVLPQQPTNSPPQANPGTNLSVTEGDSVSLQGSGTDADGDTLTYTWTQQSGPSVSLNGTSSPAATFTAPQVSSVQSLVFRLTVSDGKASHGADVSVTVSDSAAANIPPVANAGIDQQVSATAVVTLNGSGSDADSDTLSYSWVQASGPAVTLSSTSVAAPTFTAPAVLSGEVNLEFELTVSDGPTSGSDFVEIMVVNQPPAADAVLRNNSGDVITEALEGATITFDGTGSTDPDGNSLTYEWYTASAGPVSADWSASTETVSLVVPDITSTVTQQFSLKVTDTSGATDTTSVSIKMIVDNNPPMVSLAFDPETPAPHFEGSVARLVAAAEDEDGDTLTYQWRQVSGDFIPASIVPGSNDTKFDVGNALTFDIESFVTGEFEVSVSDGEFTATDTITVTMTENPDAPELSVHFPGRLSLSEDAVTTAITVRGEVTDPDGDVEVLVEDAPASLTQIDSDTWAWKATVPVSVGMNEILVFSQDANAKGVNPDRRLETVRHINAGGTRAVTFLWVDTAAIDSLTGRVFMPDYKAIYEADTADGVYWIASGSGSDGPGSGATYSEKINALETDRSQGELRVLFSQPGAVLALNADSLVRTVFSDNSGDYGSGPDLAAIIDMDMDHANGELLVLQRNAADLIDEVIAIDLATGNRRLVTSYAQIDGDLPRSIIAGPGASYLTVQSSTGIVNFYSLAHASGSVSPVSLGSCGQTYVSNGLGNGRADIDDAGTAIFMLSSGDGGGHVYRYDLETDSCAPYLNLVANGDMPNSSDGAAVTDVTAIGDYLLLPDRGAKGLFGVDASSSSGTVVRHNQRHMVGAIPEVQFSYAGALAIDAANETLFMLAPGKKAVYGIDLNSSQSWLVASDTHGTGTWATPLSIMFDESSQRLYVGARDTNNLTNKLWWLDAYGNGDKTDAGWAGLDDEAMESLHADFANGKIYFSTVTGPNYFGSWDIDNGNHSYLSTSTLGTGDLNLYLDQMVRKVYGSGGSFGFHGLNLYRVEDTGERVLIGTDSIIGNPEQLAIRPSYSGSVMIGQELFWADLTKDQVQGWQMSDGFGLVAAIIPDPRGLVYDAERDRLFVSSTKAISPGTNMAIWMVDPDTGEAVLIMQWPHTL